MNVRHELQVSAICPVDHLPDRYRCIVETSSVVAVEEILKAVDALKATEIFQEDLTQRLHRALNARVTTIGTHSGVRTRVVCG